MCICTCIARTVLHQFGTLHFRVDKMLSLPLDNCRLCIMTKKERERAEKLYSIYYTNKPVHDKADIHEPQDVTEPVARN